ncbi:MAG: type II secretion system protein GspG [Kiritimatiellia bacterium]
MKRKPPYSRRGVTLIELGFVTAIAAVLMAMVLGLAQHISAISDIRRAQSDLAAWHQAMDNWHNTFGEYPGDIIDGGKTKEYLLSTDYLANLSNVYYKCQARFYIGTESTNYHFSSCCTMPASIYDPWGTPYVYRRDVNKQAYELFSCGPDADTELPPSTSGASSTSDDIFFER